MRRHDVPGPIATLLIALNVAPTALAQSINIDFGDEHGGPPPAYSAAGLPGSWNVLTGTLEVPVALLDLDGAPTGATIAMTNAFGTLADVPLPHSEIGAHQALLGDGMLGAFGPKIPVAVAIAGIEPGLYRLITYTWYWPAQAFGEVAFVDGSALVQSVGGPWPGGLSVGVTHMVHVVNTRGTIAFELVGAGPGSFFNGDILIQGLQLWKIDEAIPCPEDVNGDGNVGVGDLLLLLTTWGACPGCAADIDGDGNAGITDLLILLAAWGPCPGSTPGKCGGAGLGDCYVAHSSGGCNDAGCCDAVCAADPFCCDAAWDALCSGLANLGADGACPAASHPNCGNSEAGSCLVAGSVPGCSDVDCCATICGFDPFCCTFAWDGLCASEAGAICD